MNKIDLCIQIAMRAHAGQVDKRGAAYILHPMAVGLQGKTDEEKMTGFLHDVVEDSDYTFEDLEREGVPASVINALKIITHGKPNHTLTQEEKLTDYYEYIQQVIESGNPLAIAVKKYDLEHNYSRAEKGSFFEKKYASALKAISEAYKSLMQVVEYDATGKSVACFAGGCFWGVQHYFEREKGVIKTIVGYTGDDSVPSYTDVRAGRTQHYEAIIVEYDPEQTDFATLSKLFFEIHDPADEEGQGPDKGAQYRSCIFYRDENQLNTSFDLIHYLREHGHVVNTQLLQFNRFWIAEKYHQDYYKKTGGSPYCHVRTKKFDI